MKSKNGRKRLKKPVQVAIVACVAIAVTGFAVSQYKLTSNVKNLTVQVAELMERSEERMAMICVYDGRECDGCMRCQSDPDPIYCEVCGKEVERIYKNADGDVVGCDNCIREIDPYA